MWLNKKSYFRIYSFLLSMIVLTSCASNSLLKKGDLYLIGNSSDQESVTIEVSPPDAEIVAPPIIGHRSYHPSELQFTWIQSIDGEPITKFLAKNEHPREIRRYHLLPGKHTFELMFEGSGKSDRMVAMFEDSVQITFEYHGTLRRAMPLEVELTADNVYTLKTLTAGDRCQISLMKDTAVVAEKESKVRYTYSNLWDPDNWYLNENVQHGSHGNKDAHSGH